MIVDVRSEENMLLVPLTARSITRSKACQAPCSTWVSNSMRKSLCTAEADAVRLKQNLAQASRLSTGF